MMDGCQICEGRRGGEPGNENIVQGVRICDYCHADRLKFSFLVDKAIRTACVACEGTGWIDGNQCRICRDRGFE